jgi:septum formation protein
MPRLILGSASPRRVALLRQLGIEFSVRASDIPENADEHEAPAEFATRLARAKGAAVSNQAGDAWVLSADTIVVIDGIVLGKPADAAAARQMLRRLSGRTHEVLTAMTLTAPRGVLADEILVRSMVEFHDLDAADIEAYIATGEPFDKAGAYGIQGAASPFVRRVTGSYSNVVGLPTDEAGEMLRRHGFAAAVDRSAMPSS